MQQLKTTERVKSMGGGKPRNSDECSESEKEGSIISLREESKLGFLPRSGAGGETAEAPFPLKPAWPTGSSSP